jgi:hypothetical protein
MGLGRYDGGVEGCAVLMVVVYNIPCLELSADILAMDLFGGVA